MVQPPRSAGRHHHPGVGHQANSYASGTTDGYLSGVQVALKILTCTFTVTGSVPAAYADSTGKLKAPSAVAPYPLTVATASAGCAGIAAVGQKPLCNATYNVVTPSGGTTRPSIVYSP